MDDFGQRLRTAMTARGYSIRRLANALEVDISQVTRWRRMPGPPSGAKLLDLCAELKAEPNYLLGWSEVIAADAGQVTESATVDRRPADEGSEPSESTAAARERALAEAEELTGAAETPPGRSTGTGRASRRRSA